MSSPPSVPIQRRRYAPWALLALALVVCGVASELALRASGRGVWTAFPPRDDPQIHALDPVLGWRKLAGTFVFPGYGPRPRPIRMTLLSDGRRATSAVLVYAERSVALVGGSLTLGLAVSDEESFAWKLQRRWPSVRVDNYGTSAYGTFQSLLVMEGLFAPGKPPPALVVYGFLGDHETRNIAGPSWLKTLARGSRLGAVPVPYCSLGPDGELVRHAPEGYPSWRMRGALAAVNFAQDVYAGWRARKRFAQKRGVTQALLLEMRRLALAHRARFLVALLSLHPRAKDEYTAWLRNVGVPFADCAEAITPDLRVPGEGHPNPAVHTRWARCLGPAIEDALGLEAG